jgi:hypothetical protein
MLLKDIFRELEAFDYKCEAFTKTIRILKTFPENEGFNKKSETFSKTKRLFEDIFNRIEHF